MPGWQYKTELFDCGTRIGIAVWNGLEGEARRREAVVLSPDGTIESGLAMLKALVGCRFEQISRAILGTEHTDQRRDDVETRRRG